MKFHWLDILLSEAFIWTHYQHLRVKERWILSVRWKGHEVINPMIFHFILEIVVKQKLSSMYKASAVIELTFFSKGGVWSVIISFFLAFLGTYSIRQKFSYISLVYRKYPFIMELTLMKNIIKTPKKIENVNDDGNK